MIRVDYHGAKEVPTGTCNAILKAAEGRSALMIDLEYSLVIEVTADPSFFGFYSPDLAAFTGVGHSTPARRDPTVVIHDERLAEAAA